MKPILRLGTAKIDITPEKPIPLAGFEHRKGTFRGILHPLYARILFFQQDLEGDRRCVLLVSADIIWWDTERTKVLKLRLQERWGLEESSIILHATHTHSGPQTSHRFTSSLGEPDDDYIQMLETRLFEGIEMASNQMEHVLVDRGIGECQMGIHRRRPMDGKMMMAPNEDGPIDPVVNVVRFRSEEGKIKALLVHYTCHPTTTEDNYVSSEFPGIAMEQIESALGENVVATFLQGCCGDIRPALIREGNFYRGSDKDVCKFGKLLADEVLSVLGKPLKRLGPCYLEGRKVEISISFQYVPLKADLEKYRKDPSVIGEWSRLLLHEPERIQPSIPLEMMFINIAKGLSLLTMNSEIVIDYGLFIKRQFAGSVLPVPYSNGMIGYIPTEKQVGEGGYEAKDSFPYFGLPAPFDSSLEIKICEAILHLVRKEHPYECNRPT